MVDVLLQGGQTVYASALTIGTMHSTQRSPVSFAMGTFGELVHNQASRLMPPERRDEQHVPRPQLCFHTPISQTLRGFVHGVQYGLESGEGVQVDGVHVHARLNRFALGALGMRVEGAQPRERGRAWDGRERTQM